MGDPLTAEADEAVEEPRRTVPLTRGLSVKLLLLTACFVLVSEVLIFVPSIANFRLNWLEERLSTAAALSIVPPQPQPTSRSV